MKAILEFNLLEEKQDHLDAINGSRYKCQIDTLYNEVFRKHIKYNESILEHDEPISQIRIIEAIWQKVQEHFEQD
jgi:hypothetical protein